jgi:hypothetical protein
VVKALLDRFQNCNKNLLSQAVSIALQCAIIFAAPKVLDHLKGLSEYFDLIHSMKSEIRKCLIENFELQKMKKFQILSTVFGIDAAENDLIELFLATANRNSTFQITAMTRMLSENGVDVLSVLLNARANRYIHKSAWWVAILNSDLSKSEISDLDTVFILAKARELNVPQFIRKLSGRLLPLGAGQEEIMNLVQLVTDHREFELIKDIHEEFGSELMEMTRLLFNIPVNQSSEHFYHFVLACTIRQLFDKYIEKVLEERGTGVRFIDDKSQVCGVCLEPFPDQNSPSTSLVEREVRAKFFLFCGHTICLWCFWNSVKQNPKCSICRDPIEEFWKKL